VIDQESEKAIKGGNLIKLVQNKQTTNVKVQSSLEKNSSGENKTLKLKRDSIKNLHVSNLKQGDLIGNENSV